MDEGEENKGCTVRRRRSSILKLPLTGIDPNKQIKQKEIKKKRRSSKRVSFAETLDVWEFNKESQSENSDKNAFRNKDESAKEISGIDSLLTGEIKNPTPVIENISDPEDSVDEGETTTLNCSVFKSPEKEFIMQNEVAIANKENINIVVPITVINTDCGDVSPANQSMYCSPDLDDTPQKLDNLRSQQLMQEMKNPQCSSVENSPVVTRRSMSTKLFLDNLQMAKDETSFSDGTLPSKGALPDSSMETSTSESPALDKSLYYIESSKQADTTIYFNRNPDQTASMDFTICNSKVFSDSFKIDSPAKQKGTNMNSPNDDRTVYFGQNLTQLASMDLTTCHGRLLPDNSGIHYDDDNSNQKMTTPMDVTKIFNMTQDTMANMELTTIQNPISFLDFSRKPIITKKMVTEDGKENVPPSVSPFSVDIKQNKSPKQIDRIHSVDMSCEDVPMKDVSCSEIKSLRVNEKVTEKLPRNIVLNSDDEKQNILKAAKEDLTEKSTCSVSFIELPVKKASQIPDAENTGSANSVKKPGKKRVSFMCPQEHLAQEPSLLDNDEPPIKKLNSGDHVDLYSQNHSLTDGPLQEPIKDQPEKRMNFIDEALISKKSSIKLGVKRVSFYDPEEVSSKNSGSDNHNELPVANISLTKSLTEKAESSDLVTKRAALTHLDQPFSKKILLENVKDQMDIEPKEVDLAKSSSLKALFPESFKGSSSNLESDTHSQPTANADNKALRSMKGLYLSLNTSGILKSFVDADSSKCESVHEDLPKSAGKQVSFLIAGEETSTGREDSEKRKPKVSLSPQSQAVKRSGDNRTNSPNGLNKSGVLRILVNKNGVESGSVDQDSTKTPVKRVSFLSTDEKHLEKKSLDLTRANTNPQSASPEERNRCLYISLNSSGILKSFVNVEDDDQLMDKTLTKTLEKQVTFCPADEQLSEKNTLDVTKSVVDPQLEKSPEDNNKYLYISLNNSGIIKSLGNDENCPPSQSVDHEDLNKSVKKRVSFRSVDDEPSGPKSESVDQNQLPTSVTVSSERLFEAPEPTNPSPNPELIPNKPTLTRLEKDASPKAEKMALANPLIQEDLNQKEKELNVQAVELVKQPDVGSIADHVDQDGIPKPERLAANRPSLAKLPNFKSSWQGMFSIENVIKNVKRNRTGTIPVAPCEPTTKTAAMSALSIMRPILSVPESTLFKDPSQEKESKNTYLNMVTNKFPSESKATSIITKPVSDYGLLSSSVANSNSRNVLTSQLPSQDVKTIKTSRPKAPENTSDNKETNSSIVYDLNFKLEDLTGIMNERSDILIESSHVESTAHVTQNQLSTSAVNNTRPSFSNKSVDDMKNSILALSSINSSLCSRMLINMHLPSLEKNLSSVEVDSIEDLLLLVGIDKLENVTIDYRRSSVDIAPVGFENKTLGERLLMSCLDQPKYQSILAAYDSLKAKEHNLLTEFHCQKLLEGFQSALKKKEASKSNEEVKNQLIEDFKKCKQLSQQKGKKQRKADRYVSLCSVLRGKLVALEEAKTELDDTLQKLDQQLESLDEVLDTLDKKLDQLDTLPQVIDEDLEQYAKVRKYLDDVDAIQTREQKLSDQCSLLRDQEKSLKEKYSSLQVGHANLSKPFSFDTSALLNNCENLKMYSVLLPWKVWQLHDDQQKYNFWNDTFQFCIHTQAEHIKKAHFEMDENWQSVAKYHPWLRIAHEMRQNVMQEKSFLENLRHISQLPELLHRISNLLNSLQDLAKEIHAVSLRKVITRQQNSILVTYCCLLSKVQVCFQFDPSNYPAATISHQVNLNYGNVRCQDISRRLQRVKPGPQYLSRLVNAVRLDSVSSPLW